MVSEPSPKRKAKPTPTQRRRKAAAWSSAQLRAVGERIYNPAWPHLETAQQAVKRSKNPKEAWEALAAKELVPFSWVDDPQRVFAPRTRCSECERDRYKPHALHCSFARIPPSIGAAVTLAAAGEEARKAEALALEFVERLNAFREFPLRYAIAWRVMSPPYFGCGGRPGDEALHHLSPLERSSYNRQLHTMICKELRWQNNDEWNQTSRNAAFHFAQDYRRMLCFAQKANEHRPNPFEPLLDLWRTGFALDGVNEECVILLSRDVTVTPH